MMKAQNAWVKVPTDGTATHGTYSWTSDEPTFRGPHRNRLRALWKASGRTHSEMHECKVTIALRLDPRPIKVSTANPTSGRWPFSLTERTYTTTMGIPLARR